MTIFSPNGEINFGVLVGTRIIFVIVNVQCTAEIDCHVGEKKLENHFDLGNIKK